MKTGRTRKTTKTKESDAEIMVQPVPVKRPYGSGGPFYSNYVDVRPDITGAMVLGFMFAVGAVPVTDPNDSKVEGITPGLLVAIAPGAVGSLLAGIGMYARKTGWDKDDVAKLLEEGFDGSQ